MKLVRYGPRGAELPGLIDDAGLLRDLSFVIADVTPDHLDPDGLDILRSIEPDTLTVVEDEPRLGAPLTDIGKIVCIGMNYADHVAETGREPPREPAIFIKATSAVTGPYDPVERPRGAQKLDYEVELAAVFGSRCKNVSERQALDHIGGYLAMIDVSERAFQNERGGGTTKGKSADSFAPIGPWLVTDEAVPDPQRLRLWTRVNGETRQDGNTRNQIFSLAHCIAYLSQFMTFEPGDILATGTPAGVANGMKPPQFLQPGDILEIGIDGLGEQRHTITEAG